MPKLGACRPQHELACVEAFLEEPHRLESVSEQEPAVHSRPVARAGRRLGRPVGRALDSEGSGPGGASLASSWTPQPGPGKALPIRPLGWWDWATWRAENARWRHGFHSTHHPRLLSQPWEGNVPSRRHPNPTKRPLLELEVRICGRRDSWVQVPAYCQSPGRWANHFWNQKRCSLPSKAFGSERPLR